MTHPLGELRLISAYQRQPDKRNWLSGTFFCYYYERDYTEDPTEGVPMLRGGILMLEKAESCGNRGIRKAHLILGLRSSALMKRASAEIFADTKSGELYTRYRAFRESVKEDEKSMYFFEGIFRDDANVITGDLKKRVSYASNAGSKEERVSLFIHGHADSAHEYYRGGLAVALRFILADQSFQTFRFGISANFLEWTAPQLRAMLIPNDTDSLTVNYQADKTWYHYSAKNHGK